MCSKGAIELLAMWAVAPSCWKVFLSLLTLKKSTRVSPRYLSECNVSKKRMGPITVKKPR
jgi:hypothetical protein